MRSCGKGCLARRSGQRLCYGWFFNELGYACSHKDVHRTIELIRRMDKLHKAADAPAPDSLAFDYLLGILAFAPSPPAGDAKGVAAERALAALLADGDRAFPDRPAATAHSERTAAASASAPAPSGTHEAKRASPLADMKFEPVRSEAVSALH